MVCHDEHLLGLDQGFSTHTHSDIDIVTYVVSGALAHTDSLGNSVTLMPGQIAWLRAGTGVEHSEVAAAPQTRFVQVWLSNEGGEPSFSVVEGDKLELPGGTLRIFELEEGEKAQLPETTTGHFFVAAGALARHSLIQPMGAGDALVMLPDPKGAESRDEALTAEALLIARAIQALTRDGVDEADITADLTLEKPESATTSVAGLEIAAGMKSTVLAWSFNTPE